METVFAIVFDIALMCLLCATLRITLHEKPKNQLLKFITHPAWCYSLFILLPAFTGEFARGEISPLPWNAFSDGYAKHGLLDGIAGALIVLSIDLWLFITTSQFMNEDKVVSKSDADLDELDTYDDNESEGDTQKVRRLRIFINLLIGFLLTTKDNNVYHLLTWLYSLGSS